MDFPDSSVGKESTCNAGDPGSISESGGSPVEGIGYPLQYSWASLVAQMVKNLPGLISGSERSPGEGNGYQVQYSRLENSMDRGAWRVTVYGVAKSQTRLSDYTSNL